MIEDIGIDKSVTVLGVSPQLTGLFSRLSMEKFHQSTANTRQIAPTELARSY